MLLNTIFKSGYKYKLRLTNFDVYLTLFSRMDMNTNYD